MTLPQNSQPLLFLGSVVPDEESFRTEAFSRAGNSAQIGLLEGLINAKHLPEYIISFLPMPTYPGSKTYFVSRKLVSIANCKGVMVSYINFPLIKPISLCFSIYREIKRQMNGRKGVIISYNFNTFLSIPMIIMKMSGTRVVPIIFDFDIPGETVEDNLYRRIDFIISKILLNFISAAIVITHQIAKDFIRTNPSIVIEGGLSNQQIQQYSNLVQENKEDTFDIVYAGALESYNGVDVIINAVIGLPDKDIRLHIAGRGSLQREVLRRAEEDERIVWHGYIDSKAVSSLYNRASLLINHRSDQRISSHYVFPSKLIEYLSTAIPVISTRFSGLLSEYEPFVELIEDESVESLQKAIVKIRETPNISQSRAREAQKFVLDHKTWDAQGRRIASFLEVVL